MSLNSLPLVVEPLFTLVIIIPRIKRLISYFKIKIYVCIYVYVLQYYPIYIILLFKYLIILLCTLYEMLYID